MQELKTGLVHLLSSAAVSAGKQSRPKTNKQSCSTIFQFPPLKHKLTKLSSFMTFSRLMALFCFGIDTINDYHLLAFCEVEICVDAKKYYKIKYLMKSKSPHSYGSFCLVTLG